MRLAPRNSLIRQVLVLVVSASLIMFTTVSALTALHERQRLVETAQAEAERNIARNLSTLSRQLWNYDMAGLKALLSGLTQSGVIVQIEVIENGKTVVDIARQTPAHAQIDRTVLLTLMSPDGSRAIGSLRVSESFSDLHRQLRYNLIVELMSELLKIGCLAIILMIIVHRRITRHLTQLADLVGLVTQVDGNESDQVFLERERQGDEIDTLTDAINRFRFQRNTAEKELMLDIEKRTKVEIALQRSEASLSEALRISKLAYWEYAHASGQFTLNAQYYALHGIKGDTPSVISLETFLDQLIHIDDQSAVRRAILAARSGNDHTWQIEVRIRCQDADTRWALMRYRTERKQDGQIILVGVSQDITDRKIIEQQIELVAQLTAQKENAELENQAKSRFLAAASHDLRQPVHALHLFLGTLKKLELPSQARRLLENVMRCSEAIDEMFVSLLDVSKLDAGLVEPQISTFPIATAVNRIRYECESQAQAKGLRFEVIPCSAWVRSDQLMLERILRNLITNAIRYTPSGRILVGCRRRGPLLRICVFDTGVGISPLQQQKVFEEFYKVGPIEPGQPGLGLGLSIVDRLAKLLNAPLHLASSQGKGSMFSIDLPVTQIEDLPQLLTKPLTGDAALDRRVIWVIDDDREILTATQGLLEEFGTRVIVGESAIAVIAEGMQNNERPDLIICDYHLRGDERGPDAIAHIRDEFNFEIPALIITGDTSPARILELRRSGISVVHKPLREAELRNSLAALLEDTHALVGVSE